MLLIFLLLSSIFCKAIAQHSIISPGSSLTPTNISYWSSESGHFAFGFYPQGDGFAIGIWLPRIQQATVIWTANRDDPPLSRNATLILNTEGKLILQQQGSEPKFIANIPKPASSASMLNSGNFVLYDSESKIIWQTFDAPTDTILPGQHLAAEEQLVSSISNKIHKSGRFALRMRRNGNLVMLALEYPLQSDYFYWKSQTANAGDNVTLNLDTNGLLYLLDTNGKNIRTLSDGRTIFDQAMYRATIDADGIFRLYSHDLDRYSNWSMEWQSSDNKCDPMACVVQMHIVLWWISTKEACRQECLKDCYCEAAVYGNQQCRKHKLPLRFGKAQEKPSMTTFIKARVVDLGMKTGGSNRKKELRTREHLTIEDLKREFQIEDSLPKQSSLVIEEIEEETVAHTDIPMQPLAKIIELGEGSWTTNHANLLCDREANVDSNIEIVNDVQCETSVSEHCVNEENSDGSVRAKEVNDDDGFNEYIDALIGSERLDDYINPIMEDNMGNFGNNSQDVPCEEQNKKGRPKATEERMRNEGFGASLRFDTTDTNSEYGDSDELHSNSDSEGDGENVRFPEFNMDRDIDDPTFKVGMIFSTRDEFKNACRAYGIKHRFELYFPKNDFQRVQARCKKEYGWKIWASKLHPKDPNDQTMQIKTASLNHSCGKSFTNYHVTAKWIASHYLETFKNNPDLTLTGLIGMIKNDYNIRISMAKAWRTKDHALKRIHGDEATQYGRLHCYKCEILRTNPGSTMTFREEKGEFAGMYICLSALKEAFKDGCRKLICLDGCWLKGTYGGQLFSAVGIDPNDCMLPLAYAIMLVENKDSWLWFLEQLKADMHMYNSHQWCFMSDKQKGLVNVVSEMFPNSEHRVQVRPTSIPNNVEDTMIDANVFRSLQTSSSQQITADATKNGPIKGNSKKQQSTVVGKDKGNYQHVKGTKEMHTPRRSHGNDSS
ncbi:hypothetical protein GH714_020829 [Hevea brasiliensis]|uniref:Bulb-type lectin domain-containing protein n=1 Tax=Hevea brasiliensis TaxID=3981 RepID=A0A6A6KQL1_HEVBR|nr:hypothetical protein GH714_020829 [Hevea brasiliensis]